MGIKAEKAVIFSIIDETLKELAKSGDQQGSVTLLCRLVGASRGGYYWWKRTELDREQREAKDQADYQLILQAYQHRGYAKGARSIHMRLLHLPQAVRMNIKKIRRLMKKYGLVCPIRCLNPYRRMAKAIRTSYVADNIVHREFKQGVRKVLLTDITYLFFPGGVCYLSTILDAFTHEILAYQLSSTLKVEFVLSTIGQLVAAHGSELDDETIIHSDQGCHYTSKSFVEKLKDENFVQSMSRKGNCWDNAPQESLFGHMKDEIGPKIDACKTFQEMQELIDDWVDYYNNERYQWGLRKLSPAEYYKYITTGQYPLEQYPQCTA